MSDRSVDPAAVVAAVTATTARIRELAAGRDVTLIAVTKGFGADAIEAAVGAGCTAIGENADGTFELIRWHDVVKARERNTAAQLAEALQVA